MPDLRGRYVVETDWLAEHLNAPDLIILDGSLPQAGKTGTPKQDYAAAHIPGALFFDIDDIKDETNPLPHMLPSPAKFASKMKAMGIGDGMRVVAYDNLGLYSAARVWWMFRVMGAEDVSVLNGGLPKWKAEGRPLMMSEPAQRTTRHFTARHNLDLVRDVDDMKTAIKDKSVTMLDARSAERFAGTSPEPREGLRAGHMPGAHNVPYKSVLNADGTLKSRDELHSLFEAAGVDPHTPAVTTCGSGITACVLALALAETGHLRTSVYDGSWAEWGANESLPIETG